MEKNSGSSPCFTFFLLEQKEPKIQERLIARPRTRSALRAWVNTLYTALPVLEEQELISF